MDTPRNLRAGLYDRVSKKATGPEARSVAEQNRGNRRACERYSWPVVAHYSDPGISASRHAKRERDDWPKILADVEHDRLDAIVFWETSRGDRKLHTGAAFLSACRDHNVLIYVTSHDRLYDMKKRRDWRTLAEDFIDAEDESFRTSERVNRAIEANLAAGRPHGNTPFGMIREYDRYRELVAQRGDPETVEIPREIIRRVAAWEPVKTIANDMAARQAPTPKGGKWTPGAVRRIALNHQYVGLRHYDPERTGDGVTYEGMPGWEAIIDLETWQAAHDRLTSSKRGSFRPGTNHQYLLSYLGDCGSCGGKLSARPKGQRVPHQLYRCRERSCVNMRMDWLDDYVTGATCALIDTDAFWAALAGDGGDEVSAAAAEEKMLRRRLEEYVELAAAGKLDASVLAMIAAKLQPQIDDAAHRATQTAVMPPVLLDLREVHGMDAILAVWYSWPMRTRKAVVRAVWDKIELLRAGRIGKVTEFNPQRVRLTPNPKLAKAAAGVSLPSSRE